MTMISIDKVYGNDQFINDNQPYRSSCDWIPTEISLLNAQSATISELPLDCTYRC